MDAYCVRCKNKRAIQDPKHFTTKNNKPAVSGTCATCGTRITAINVFLPAE